MMDLFPVTRYLGNEEGTINNVDNVEEHMCNLLTKIQQRSKQKNITHSGSKGKKRAQSKSNVSPSISTPSIDPPKKEAKVKKKQKKTMLLESTIPQNNVEPSNVWEGCDILQNDMIRLKLHDKDHRPEYNGNDDDDKDNVNRPINKLESIEKEVFPVIGDFKFKKKNKVKRVLPEWLAQPSVVSVDLKHLSVSISDIPNLHGTFINTLKKNNVSHFFPVQAQVIPWLLDSASRSSFFWPCDICVSAPTGSGKTLAYVLPVLQALMGSRIGQIQALVVLPVQDLAAQVATVFRAYSANTGLRIHLSTKALSLQEDRIQLIRQRLGVGWESLVDILVITPGRLVEHLYTTPGFSLKHLQYIVVDEADRIVDNMQNNWLHHLDQHLGVEGTPLLTLHSLKTHPRRPQKLLFSATLSIDPEKLNQLNLFHPRLFTSVVEATKDQGVEGEFIGKFTTPAELQEHMVRCPLAVKPLALYRLISRECWTRVLVFTASSRSVHQLRALLSLLASKTQRQLRVQEISVECSPITRKSVLKAFAEGKIDVLVSTDALARGMDISGVQYVISYDMPKYVKAYIHRVGRTGRAGQQGVAVTMVTHTQVGMFQQMLQTAGKQDSVTELPMSDQELKALEEPFKEALKELKSVTEGEEAKKLNKTKSLKRVTSIKVFSKKRKVKKDHMATKRIKTGN